MISQAAVQNSRVPTVVLAPLSSRAGTRFLSILAGLVLVYAIILAAGDLLSIGFFFEKNYNEGWNVYNFASGSGHEFEIPGLRGWSIAAVPPSATQSLE